MTRYDSLSAAELLHALETAGRAPHLDLIRACLARREELTPTLLEWLARAGSEEWLDDDPRWYREIHAGLLLIGYRESSALPLFDRIYREEERSNLLDWFDTELPAYGPAATGWAIDLVSDPRAAMDGRVSATEILGTIAYRFPEERERIVTALRALLPPLNPNGEPDLPESFTEEPDPLWTWAGAALAELKDTASQPQMKALYEADLIDEIVMGDVDEYLAMFDADASPPAASYATFDIVDTYRSLQAQTVATARRTAEAAALRGEQLALQSGLLSQHARAGTILPSAKPRPYVRSQPKIGRNEPCPCGSGKKYKHCHGKKQ